ncbi:peptidase domain-containing ABC transporter [Oceanicella sp. SM1341]|uniref:peptidase domain-containing ABC transporter n=1 Tax=Oceanicella sp. SM1341 TaxID=1548889 RepID=UPI0018E4FCB1|nr:ATP-binding cassette domain-containing protein [Oceanicella sp. SM1341]
MTLPLAAQVRDVEAREGEIFTLYTRLRSTCWNVEPEGEPLALAFCALVLRLDPLIDARRIAEALPASQGRFQFTDCVNALANLGYRYTRIAMAPDLLDRRLSPCLYLRGEDAVRAVPLDPCVLWAGHGEGEALSEFSGAQECVRPPEEGEGDAILFTRIEEDRLEASAARRRQSGHGWFRTILGRFAPRLRTVLLLGVLINLLALAGPLFILLIYDRVIGPKAPGPMPHLVAGIVIVLVSEFLLRRARSLSLIWITTRLDYIVGIAIFGKLLQLPATLVQRAAVSDQIARVKTFEAIRDFFCGPVLLTALELPAALVSLLAIGLLAPGVLPVPLVAIAAFVLVFLLIWRRVQVQIRRAAIESSVMQQFSIDTFAKLEAIQIDGLAGEWTRKYREISGRELTEQFRLFRLGMLGEIGGHVLIGLASLATLWAGVSQIWSGGMGTGALIAVMMLLWRALAPFHNLCAMIPRLEQMRNSIQQIDLLMDAEEESDAARGSQSAMRLTPSVSLANVAVRYDAAMGPVFTGLDMEIRPGEVVAVTGPNGSGKSSVLKLVLGMTPPAFGGVRISGFDIRQLNPRDLRQNIAYVPQTVDLFTGSIADNLRMVMPLSDEDTLRAVLDEVGATARIAELPEGLDTVISATGQQVCGPILRQRIGLARALLKPARILLIDEQPNATLIGGLDASLRGVIERQRGRRTILFVTYRRDMMRLADRVIALRPGQRPVTGSPDKIMELS